MKKSITNKLGELKLCKHGLPLFQICWDCKRIPGESSPLRKQFKKKSFIWEKFEDQLSGILMNMIRDYAEHGIGDTWNGTSFHKNIVRLTKALIHELLEAKRDRLSHLDHNEELDHAMFKKP